jgi:hypothetical protein
MGTLRPTRALHILLLLTTIALPGTATAAPPICVIDMGSNSFRRIVGAFEQGRYTQIRIEKRTVGVGDDVTRHGRISDGKLTEIQQVLSAFRDACRRENVSPVRAIGTAAFRDAPNARAVIDIARSLGIDMEIATEQRESELAYLVGSLGRDGYAVIDNGSRSIELVAKDAGRLQHVVFNLGYRVAYDKYFAAVTDPAAAVAAFRDQLLREASKAAFMKGRVRLVGVEFGEMTDVLFEPAPVERRVLTLMQMKRRLDEITRGGPAAFRTLKQKPDIDRALPRLVAAVALIDAFGYSQMEFTDRELGVGLIIEAAAS